jgi:hypothetical protein
MAFTTDQEAKLLQIIGAFDSGKRLDELPDTVEGSAGELIIEVLDTDGESKQVKVGDVFDVPEDGKSAYEVWLSQGNEGSEEDFLATLKGNTGKSAYQVWLDEGGEGSEEDFLATLKGSTGKSAYQVWLNEGHEGTEADYLASLKGTNGVSAYGVWLAAGHEGSLDDYLASLKGSTGKSAYQSWLDEGHEGTEADYLASLKGNSGLSAYGVWLAAGNQGTEADFIASLKAVADIATEAEAVAGDNDAKIITPYKLFLVLQNALFSEEKYFYGVEWNKTVTSPPMTRVGNPDLHHILPVQNKQKGCLLSDSGVVRSYLPDDSWLGSDRSGASGQVMVEIPEFFYKLEASGNIVQMRFSERPLPGYQRSGKGYYSAYEPTIQISTGMLSSVANMDPDFRGGNNNAAWDDTYRTLLGRPSSNKTRTAYRAAARLRGARWGQFYSIRKSAIWLYMVEFANRNSQAPFNAQLDSNGYKQGGLGTGATTLSSTQWNNFNTYYPFIPCGHTDGLGNKSGEVTYTATNLPVAQSACRYRGIENIFGHIWEWEDGINVLYDGSKNVIYVCDDPALFSDTGNEGYEMRGNSPTTSGYITDMILGKYADLLPAAVGGSDAAHWTDYGYENTTAGIKGVLFGGSANDGSIAGIACSDAYRVPASAYAHIGSRLCFSPA